MVYEEFPSKPHGEHPISPETEYLIADLEEKVSDVYTEVLHNAPYTIRANGYHPELLHGERPTGLDLLETTYLQQFSATPGDFIGMDLLFHYPLESDTENPWNIAVKWSNGLQCRLAKVGGQSILLVEDSGENGHTHHAELVPMELMELYVESLGLPNSFIENDIKELTRDLYSCSDFNLTQRAELFVDPYTTLELVYDAQMHQDIDDDKQLVQELLINIDHLDQTEYTTLPDEMPPAPYMRYRNMLRFERNESQASWRFMGAYHGKLGTGELIDELVQIDPTLGIPGSKVLEKAFNGLTT